MKKLFSSMLVCIAAALQATSQIAYDAASIPATLQENADVVKRFEEIKFEVKDVDRAIYRVHRVYTVLNEKAASRFSFVEHTTKFKRIEDFDIKCYDGNGRVVDKYRKKDLHKQAVFSGLVSDGFVHFINPRPTRYPATIEYEYEIEYTGTAWYPEYEMQEPGESIQYSTFIATAPPDLDLRFKARHTNIKPEVSLNGKVKMYKWTVQNQSATPDEENEASANGESPGIVLAPNKFRLYNTYGDMSSWKSFGVWGYQLLEGRDQLPAERLAFFSDLVKDAKTDQEKVAIIYDYLQKNFRYVAITLGLGGWQPFPARFTDEKKYGDCKGLSFYVSSILKHLNIKSYCALIYRDYVSEEIDPDFPQNTFNHVILCVPINKDTIWLECTSNTLRFATLDATTAGRKALLLTEQGGVLVSTPNTSSANNVVSTTTQVWLQADGSGKSSSFISTRGEWSEIAHEIGQSNKDEQKSALVRFLGFKQPDEFSVAQNKHAGQMGVEMTIEKIPQFTAGTKMFLNQHLNLKTRKLPSAKNRKTDFYFSFPFTQTDTTVYHLPDGYYPEVLPKATSSKCDYGEYEINVIYDAEKKQVISVSRLQLNQHRIPAAKYEQVKTFFDKLATDQSQKLVVKTD